MAPGAKVGRLRVVHAAVAMGLVTVMGLVWLSPPLLPTSVKRAATRSLSALGTATVPSAAAAGADTAHVAALNAQIASLQAQLRKAKHSSSPAPKSQGGAQPLSPADASSAGPAAANSDDGPAASPETSVTMADAPVSDTSDSPDMASVQAVNIPAKMPVPTKEDLVHPAGRYAGIYTQQAPYNWADVDQVASEVQQKPDVVGYFGGWDEDFRPDAVRRAWAKGMLPMLTWQSRPHDAPNDVTDLPAYSLSKITGDPRSGTPGEYDAYLHRYAAAVAALGMPVAIRLDHEMNGQWYPWSEATRLTAKTQQYVPINGNSPGEYVRMWRHVHDIFDQEGANGDVIWVWSPTRIDNLPNRLKTQSYLATLYPGDDYVDWMGLSGYYRRPTPSKPAGFADTFDASLTQLRRSATSRSC